MESFTLLLTDKQLYDLAEYIALELNTSISWKSIDTNNRYMNKKQTCEYLQISNNTLDNWITRGFPQIKINQSIRYDRLAIDDWLKQLEKTS
ncbi:helix-turn-helix domain-containing protein [Enterococcus faecalis]|uniref:helix-turn-helix domain-containing protein n=1 Tax=Enterococcus faecalis TaxID=1351 RepID=UPI0025AFBA72|nr:helix-turn-helix domain-containing protein [Enterococcus faecalis]MDN3095142.1 helix-turn-helix domain-containing protein [Enterococcus faecalis]